MGNKHSDISSRNTNNNNSINTNSNINNTALRNVDIVPVIKYSRQKTFCHNSSFQTKNLRFKLHSPPKRSNCSIPAFVIVQSDCLNVLVELELIDSQV